MNKHISYARLAALPLAVAGAFPLAALAQMNAGMLPETVITATRFPEQAASLPLGVSVITAPEIRAAGVSTVNEALMRLLGVVGRQDLYGGGDYALDLRGFGATADSNQAVIVDGIKINEADQGGTRLAGIPIESVERIEVLRGSGAVLYGEGATAGAIIITTKAGAGKERKNSASVYAGAGRNGLREGRANATVAGGGFSVDMSGVKRKADNHRDNFQSDLDGVSVTGQWANDWLRAGVRYAEDRLDTGLPGSLTAAEYAANPRQTTTPGDHASIDNQRTTVFAAATLGDWQLAADVGHREKQLRSISAFGPYDYDIEADNAALRVRHATRLAGFDNVFVVGTDHGRWTRDVQGAFGSVSKATSRAFYLKDDLTLPGSRTRLSAGLRTERIEKTSVNTTNGVDDRQNAWELGVSQPLGAAWTVYARLGRSFRLANVDEFGFTNPAVALRPQTSRDTELGARWVAAGTKVDARLYRSAIDNEIGYDPNGIGPFGPFGSNINFDPTRRQGIEINASHAVSRTVDLTANAALRRSTFRSGPYAGRQVPLSPNRTLSLRAGWQVSPSQRLTGGINLVSSQRPDFANQCRMPGYTTADVRYAYQWRNTELSLGVSNLSDRKFYTQAFGCVGGITTSIYPEAGRAVTAALRYTF
ncbi:MULTISPECIES: TonB-dependent receptor [unclassified Acidovorax]|uniref:TonB-dependent receptor n=1 Tax=unclassified Acidovorax TaxID=2684926 RepID=UPI000B3F8E4A|nr:MULTISPECIES: TonB-dependent receptor [unclassified Acidovorax]